MGQETLDKLVSDPGLNEEAKEAITEVNRAAQSFRASSAVGAAFCT